MNLIRFILNYNEIFLLCADLADDMVQMKTTMSHGEV